jgi:shikimate kinase
MSTFRTSQAVSAADAAIPHLILVGLPGAGKSTIGKAVAAELKRNYLDLDAEIERREGITIGEIFGSRGEKHFRELEKRVTEELRDLGGYVVSPGAGWMTNPGCLELVRPPSIIIYLQIQPDRALKRMGAQSVARPILNHPDPLGQLTKLLAEREPTYLLADHTVRVDFRNEKEVTASIVAIARPVSQD